MKAMKQQKKRTKKGEPQRITKAVTHIRLVETNPGKLVALDALAQVFLALTQHYTTLFCTDELPNAFHAPCFLTTLSERWQRVAIQQAAGIAKSWRTNRANAYQSYLDELAEYREHQADGTLEAGTGEPAWREWDVPTLREICIQANYNVVQLEPSTAGAPPRMKLDLLLAFRAYRASFMGVSKVAMSHLIISFTQLVLWNPT